MRFVVRLLFLASLAAVLLVPAATAADRMWVGFQDDPMFRWDDTRTEALDRARGNEASVIRTIVEWTKVAPTAARAGDGPVRPGLPVRRRRRVRPQRAAARARGADHALGHARLGERRPEAAGDAAQPRGLPELRACDRVPLLGPLSRLPVRSLLHDLERVEPRDVPRAAVQRARARSSAPRTTRSSPAPGIAGIKAGNRKALVAIGETSSNGRDKKRPGLTDTVAPATFMKGVAAALRGVRFDAYAHHPYPFPVNQKPTQLVRYPNVTLKSMPRFEKDLDAAFRRKNIPIWITEYGNETKPGEPKGVTEAQQAAYIPQAIAMAKADKRVQMFVWFVMQDSQRQPLAERHLPDHRCRRSPGSAAFDRAARGLSPVNGKVTVKGGHAEPARDDLPARVLREQRGRRARWATPCAAYLGSKLVAVDQGAGALGIDCTVPVRVVGLTVAKGRSYRVTVAGEHAATGRDRPHDHGRRRLATPIARERCGRPSHAHGLARTIDDDGHHELLLPWQADARQARGRRSPRSQHFLRSSTLAAELVAGAGLARPTSSSSSEPGTGRLTAALASGSPPCPGGRVDPRSPTPSGGRWHERRGRRGRRDARRPAAEPFRVVANLPFARTTEILHALLDDRSDAARAAPTSSSSGTVAHKLGVPVAEQREGRAVGRWYEVSVARRLPRAPSRRLRGRRGRARLPAARASRSCRTRAPRRSTASSRTASDGGCRSVVGRASSSGSARAGATARDLDAHEWATLFSRSSRRSRPTRRRPAGGEWSRGGSNP